MKRKDIINMLIITLFFTILSLVCLSGIAKADDSTGGTGFSVKKEQSVVVLKDGDMFVGHEIKVTTDGLFVKIQNVTFPTDCEMMAFPIQNIKYMYKK
jgi:hypothetical protein